MINTATFFEYISDDEIDKEKIINAIIPELPTRATKHSAGYDIQTPMDIDLKPGESVVIPTLLKCCIADGLFLWIVPKSGLGFKYFVRLANTCGIIDGDYYNNVSNEGHIMVKIRNESDRELHISAGKAFCQGIFLPYYITTNDNAAGERQGGFGSTKK